MKTEYWETEEKMVFIKRMKTTIQEGRGKRGVHQANEHHNPRRPRKKWCSSRG